MESQQPDILEIARELMADLQDRFLLYFIGGLPIGIVSILLIPIAVFTVYGAMFAGMVPGMVADDEALVFGGMVGGVVLGVAVAGLLMVVVLTPFHASLGRAMLRHLNKEEDLSFSAPFSTATTDLGNVYAYALLHMGIGMLLTSMCYLPGLLWYFFTDFAWCRVVLEQEKPFDAMRWSFTQVKENFAWHFAYFGILIGVIFIISYLPLIGAFLVPSMGMAWRIYVYSRGLRGGSAIEA